MGDTGPYFTAYSANKNNYRLSEFSKSAFTQLLSRFDLQAVYKNKKNLFELFEVYVCLRT